jgi:hypothetical protein
VSQPASEQPGSEQPGSEQPGRYQRTTGALVGALVVTLLAITGFVVFRAVNREQVEVRPEPVDYLAAVAALQQGGLTPIYPSVVPDGWMVTSIDRPAGEGFEWGMGLLTADDEFIGVRQADGSVDELVEEYVDPVTRADGQVTVTSGPAPTWSVFTDEGGDTGLAAEVGGQTVLVFGSASQDELVTVAEALTTDPV